MLLRFFSRLLRTAHQQERGQALWLAAGLIAVFGGMVAFAIDLGSLMADRRDHQNAADAIALAASLELPDESEALAKANEWAVKNGYDPNDMTATVIPQNVPSQPNPAVHVTLEGEHDFTFARLVGINSAPVAASAEAIKTSAAGGQGIVPFSITEDALAAAALGDEVILKYDANDIDQGNTSPIRIDGSGSGNCTTSDNYCAGVKYGSESVVCAEGADDSYCTGPSLVQAEPGNMIGGTRNAIDWRITQTDVHCDEFDEVFEDDPTASDAGTYRIVQECNPFLEGGYDSYRVAIIPVIEELCDAPGGGACEITIVDFALVFLEGFVGGGCNQGNECQIVGRFVRVNQNVGLLAGTFDPESSNQFVRLVK